MRAIGRLDRKITIQSYSHTIATNGFGQPNNNYTNQHTVWASVKTSRGNEKYLEGRDVAFNQVTFTIRHIADLNTKMRVSYDNRFFDILFIEDSEVNRDDFQILHTQEVVSNS